MFQSMSLGSAEFIRLERAALESALADAGAADMSNHPVTRSACHPSFKRRGAKNGKP